MEIKFLKDKRGFIYYEKEILHPEFGVVKIKKYLDLNKQNTKKSILNTWKNKSLCMYDGYIDDYNYTDYDIVKTLK